MSTSSATALPRHDAPGTPGDMPLPVVRSPMLSPQGHLFAYELLLHHETPEADDEAMLMQRLLSTIVDGSIKQLARGNQVFLRLSRELLLERGEFVAQHQGIGLTIDLATARDAVLLECLQQLAKRNCALLLELGEQPLPAPGSVANGVLSLARFVRLDTSRLTPALLRERCTQLHARGLQVIAGHVDDHDTFHRCQELPFAAVQGGYLLLPEKVDVPALGANRLSVLRLLRALQEECAGPVELGQIIRDDAVLSFKLLSCVNSAYFALPRQLKSVEQAAIFFGQSRMRNWISTLALSGMNDRPPELLRAALIRAHMCEQLAQGMSREQREMAFTAGLFSLLDSLMCAPMDFVLQQLPLAPEISSALLHQQGPFAPLLEQVRRWEAGEMRSGDVQPQQIRRMAAAYLEATRWADHVYAFAEQ